MAATSGISDDWEELNSDSFSVLSLPASDDGLLEDQPSRSRPATPSQSSLQTALRSMSLETNELPQYKEKEIDHVEQCGTGFKDIVDADRNSDNGSLNDILDIDINPNFLYQVATSLIKLIDEIVHVIQFQTRNRSLIGTEKTKSICADLKGDLQSLAPILQGYSKHWKPEGPTPELPIDPSLVHWMTKLRVELLQLEYQLYAELRDLTSSSTVNESHIFYGADKHNAALGGFAEQLKAFMPILQADYDGFHTAHMSILDEKPTTSSSSCGWGKSPTTCRRPGSDIAHLRRMLYSLKDQVVTCVTELESLKKSGLTIEAAGATTWEGLLRSYLQVKSSLDTMLSNHASDWIECGLSGGFTYPEFCRLNPDTIRSFTLQLKELTENLFLHRCRVDSLRWMSDRDDIIVHDIRRTVDTKTIEGLRTVEDVLYQILRLKPADAPAASNVAGPSRS